MKSNLQKGFTLVELAIVLMIIGLLIGGILRGQELMENARVSTTVQQVTAYQGAKHTFQDAYAQAPGDMATALTRLPGCTAANACANGDGNGLLGDSASQGQAWTNVPSAINTENTQFWKHLAMAHMISGVNPSATQPNWGASHPVAKIGGGFFMRFSNSPGGIYNGGFVSATSSNFAVLRNGINGDWTCGGAVTTGTCAISPARAAQIDRKMDDGVATTGDVIAISANWANGCGSSNIGVNGPSGYGEGLEDKACDMMFKIP